MAKYAISPQGVQELRKLATSLNSAVDAIRTANNSLQNNIRAAMESAGIYGIEIWGITLKIGTVLEDGEENVNDLINAIKKQAGEIEQLFSLGGYTEPVANSGLPQAVGGNSIDEKLGKEFVCAMNDVISNSKYKDVKAIYEKYASSLKVADADHKGGAFYRYGDGVHLNKRIVEQGDEIHRPYQTAFHEFGHNIDYLMGRGSPISESWGSGKLLDAIIEDYNDMKGPLSDKEFISKIQKQARDEGWSATDTASVSDMLECLTGIDYPLGAGHGADYWVNPKRLPCKEFFAEVLDGAAANDGSYMFMKKYFPKAVEVVHRIIGGGQA